MNMIVPTVQNLPQQVVFNISESLQDVSADFLMELLTTMYDQQFPNYNSDPTIQCDVSIAGDSALPKEDARHNSKKSQSGVAINENPVSVNFSEINGYFQEGGGLALPLKPENEKASLITKLQDETQHLMVKVNAEEGAVNPQYTEQVSTSAGERININPVPSEYIYPRADFQIVNSLGQHGLLDSARQTLAVGNTTPKITSNDETIKFSVLDLRSYKVLDDFQALEILKKVQSGSSTGLIKDFVQIKLFESGKGTDLKPNDPVTGLNKTVLKGSEVFRENQANENLNLSSQSSLHQSDIFMQSPGKSLKITDEAKAQGIEERHDVLQDQPRLDSTRQDNQHEQPSLLAFNSRPGVEFLKMDSAIFKDNAVNILRFRDNLHEIAQGILKEAKLMIQDGKSEVSLKLEPESLGSVILKVVSQDGRVSAEFNVRTQDARSYIESALPQMREMLTGNGISMQNMSVNLQGSSAGDREKQNLSWWKSRQHYDYKTSMDIEESIRNFGYNTMEMKI